MLKFNTNNPKHIKARDALRRFANTDDGIEILTFLNGERLRLLGQSAYSPNATEMYREQGGAQVLDALNALIADSSC